MSKSKNFILEVIKGLKYEVSHLLTRDLPGAERNLCQKRIERLFDYTMGSGKCLRSCLAFDTYTALCPGTSKDYSLSVGKVSATLELLQTFFLIMDDVVDHGILRRNKPCWHRLPGIGLTATNDGLLLDNAIDLIVRQAIPDHPKVETIIQNIYEAKRRTVIGQILDCDTHDVTDFKWSRYKAIVDNKTSHYTYYLPLTIAFNLADRSDSLQQLRQLAYKLGYLFQAQDDYLDCFGDIKLTGKSGNDLTEGKCTWITCRFFENEKTSSPSNRKLIEEFREHFGIAEHIEKLRDLIRSMHVDDDFRIFQNNTLKELRADIEKFPLPAVRLVLHSAIDDITYRKK